jgi:hypothetical protein
VLRQARPQGKATALSVLQDLVTVSVVALAVELALAHLVQHKEEHRRQVPFVLF